MLTTENLIRKGYFPDEIIPPFNTEELADCLSEIAPISTYTCKKSKCVNMDIPKLKTFRRNLGIPNPLHQIKLSKLIEDNWTNIDAFLAGSILSITPISISPTSRRSIEEPDFFDKTQQQILRSTSSRYLLQLDISRFYPSIYTHSIPWAIHTKPIAKASMGTSIFRSLYGNLIDEAVRNSQDQQTIGIPIGPDTSRVISEMIGAAIDKELKASMPNIVGLRHIDDFYFYFKTLAEVEKAKSIVQTIIREYELELNPRKVKIAELPYVVSEPWLTQLRNFKFSTNPKSQKKDIVEYFNLVFDFTNKYPDDYVLSYAISRIQFIKIDNSNFELFECLVLQSIQAEPKVIRNVLSLLLQNQNEGRVLNRDRIKETLDVFLEYHSDLENIYEISWALWICKSFEIIINEKNALKITTIDNSIVALVTLDLYHSGLLPAGVGFALWESQMNSSSLYSENWLLAFEAYIKNWLPRPSDYVERDDFFKELFENRVEFYDELRQADFNRIVVENTGVSLGVANYL